MNQDNCAKKSPKKSLGQNFLIDTNIADGFVASSGVKKTDTVIEIGAGMGAVTKPLSKRGGKIIAVEFDRSLIPILKKETAPFKNVEIVNGDILDILPTVIGKIKHKRYKIIGSIPYNITSPLLHKIIALKNPPASVTFIVQYEVAQKITAKAPRATYLSNLVLLYGKGNITAKIPPSAFSPKPKVFSAIIHIKKWPEDPAIGVKEMATLLHRGFKFPRKMLNKSFTPDILKRASIPGNLRPANIPFEKWIELYKTLP